MDNKKLKHLLLKGIVDSDFLFLNQKSVKQMSHIQLQAKHQNTKITSLNLFETLKGLKQLIRSLKFLSESESKMLHVWLRNKQYLYVLDLLINKTVWDIDLSIKNTLVRKPSNKLKTQLLFLLDFPLKDNKKIIKRIFNENIFLPPGLWPRHRPVRHEIRPGLPLLGAFRCSDRDIRQAFQSAT